MPFHPWHWAWPRDLRSAIRHFRCEVSRNLEYGCAVGLDLLFGHKKNVPQVPADPRWMRDMCYTLGLSPKPGAKTNRATLRSAEPLWRRHSAESHVAPCLFSLLPFRTGPQPSQPWHFWRLQVRYFIECLSIWVPLIRFWLYSFGKNIREVRLCSYQWYIISICPFADEVWSLD